MFAFYRNRIIEILFSLSILVVILIDMYQLFLVKIHNHLLDNKHTGNNTNTNNNKNIIMKGLCHLKFVQIRIICRRQSV